MDLLASTPVLPRRAIFHGVSMMRRANTSYPEGSFYWQRNVGIGATVPRRQGLKIEALARLKGVSKSAVIREAVSLYLKFGDFRTLLDENHAMRAQIRDLQERLAEVRSAPCGLCGGSGVGLRELPPREVDEP